MFWCYPNPSKCEWQSLRLFVEHYNQIYGCSYQRSVCLDVVDRHNKQPELLLVDSCGAKRMVVERKCICWPRDYVKLHSKEHLVADRLIAAVSSVLKDSLYCLELQAVDLRRDDKSLATAADSIAACIQSNVTQVRQPSRLGGTTPIKWHLSGLPQSCRDEEMPKVGLVIQIQDQWTTDDPAEWQSERKTAKAETSKTVTEALLNCGEKFKHYDNTYIRAVVLEFYGKISEFLEDDEIATLIRIIKRPPNIDQIWLAHPEYLSDTEWTTAFERIC